jgi:hypothetical protein
MSSHTNVAKAPTRSINDALLGAGAGVTSPEPQRTVFSALMQTAKGLKPPPRSSVVDANRGRGGARGRGRGRGRGGKGRAHWSRPAKRCFTSCPAFKIVAGTDLVVDGFLYAHPQLSMRYFLTHFHSDHYTGLDKHFSAGTVSRQGTSSACRCPPPHIGWVSPPPCTQSSLSLVVTVFNLPPETTNCTFPRLMARFMGLPRLSDGML